MFISKTVRDVRRFQLNEYDVSKIFFFAANVLEMNYKNDQI